MGSVGAHGKPFTMLKRELSHEYLRKILHYNPLSGEFRWLRSRGRGLRGMIAGSVTGVGYRQIQIDGIFYYASRLAWFYMTKEWPEFIVDHENENKEDNSWDNLREATDSQNKIFFYDRRQHAKC